MPYTYNNGDGTGVLDKTTPNGATEPVSNLDDAIRQIKAWIRDPLAGYEKLGADVVALQAGFTTLSSSAANFIAYTGATQDITSVAGATIVQLANTTLNTGTVFATGTYKFTAPSAGFYHFFAALGLTTQASAAPTAILHRLSVYVNNAEALAVTFPAGTDTTGRIVSFAGALQLAKNDTVDIRYTLTVGSGTMTSRISASGVESYLRGNRLSS